MPGHIKGERHATQRILGNLWEDYATAKMVTDIQIPGGKTLLGQSLQTLSAGFYQIILLILYIKSGSLK